MPSELSGGSLSPSVFIIDVRTPNYAVFLTVAVVSFRLATNSYLFLRLPFLFLKEPNSDNKGVTLFYCAVFLWRNCGINPSTFSYSLEYLGFHAEILSKTHPIQL